MDECPFCGHDQFYTKDYQYGSVEWSHCFDGECADNSESLDSLNVRCGKIAYCRSCDKKIGKMKIVLGRQVSY